MSGNDLKIIDRVLAGDSAAFAELVLCYQDRLIGSLAQILRSIDDAHDIAQDAFVQAYLKLETFQRKSGFYTWLYRIAVNLALSYLRKKNRKKTLSLDHMKEQTDHEATALESLPSEKMERKECIAQVQRAINQMSDDHRAILTLREIESFSYEEISHILEIPIGTVRSRLLRARLQLRDRLVLLFQENPENIDPV